ncbi:MAG TPA: helix-turn-helix domain-containing protein [Pseudonocardiaceae bacterium]
MAARRGRPPRSEGPATRDRMLQAALELFALQGFHATTVRQIAAAVGVRDSAIYAHFAGKQAIYDELFAEAGPPSFEALHVDVEALVAAGPRQGLTYLVDRLFATWSTRRARLFASVVIREGSGAGGLGGLGRAIEAARDRLEEPFQRWQEAGLVRSDVDPRQLVWELFGPLNVARFVYLRAESGETAEADIAHARQWVDDHLTFFLTCITNAHRAPSRGRANQERRARLEG